MYSHCLEKKMASFVGNQATGNDVSIAKGGLIHGNFDVEELLAELTVEEKASLLAGNVSNASSHLLFASDVVQERTFGTLQISPG